LYAEMSDSEGSSSRSPSPELETPGGSRSPKRSRRSSSPSLSGYSAAFTPEALWVRIAELEDILRELKHENEIFRLSGDHAIKQQMKLEATLQRNREQLEAAEQARATAKAQNAVMVHQLLASQGGRAGQEVAQAAQSPPHSPSTGGGGSAQTGFVYHDMSENAKQKESSDGASAEHEKSANDQKRPRQTRLSHSEYPFPVGSWKEPVSLAPTKSHVKHPEKSPMSGFSEQFLVLMWSLIHLFHGTHPLPLDNSQKPAVLDTNAHPWPSYVIARKHDSTNPEDWTCKAVAHIMTKLYHTSMGSTEAEAVLSKFDPRWHTSLKEVPLDEMHNTFECDDSVDSMAFIETLQKNHTLKDPFMVLLGCFIYRCGTTYFFDVDDDGEWVKNDNTSANLAERATLPHCRVCNGLDKTFPMPLSSPTSPRQFRRYLNIRLNCQCHIDCRQRFNIHGRSRQDHEATQEAWKKYDDMRAAGAQKRPRPRSSDGLGDADDDTPKEK